MSLIKAINNHWYLSWPFLHLIQISQRKSPFYRTVNLFIVAGKWSPWSQMFVPLYSLSRVSCGSPWFAQRLKNILSKISSSFPSCFKTQRLVTDNKNINTVLIQKYLAIPIGHYSISKWKLQYVLRPLFSFFIETLIIPRQRKLKGDIGNFRNDIIMCSVRLSPPNTCVDGGHRLRADYLFYFCVCLHRGAAKCGRLRSVRCTHRRLKEDETSGEL